jgi:hypothetical protein
VAVWDWVNFVIPDHGFTAGYIAGGTFTGTIIVLFSDALEHKADSGPYALGGIGGRGMLFEISSKPCP